MSRSYTPSKLPRYGITIALVVAAGYFVFHNHWIEGNSNYIYPNSIWFLPFVYVGDDEYGVMIGDGLSEELFNKLTQYESLRIYTFAGTDQLPGTYPKTHEEIDRNHFRANFVVEGSVQIIDDQIHVVARLFDMKLNKYLWRNEYEVSRAEFFEEFDSLESKIADNIYSSVTK